MSSQSKHAAGARAGTGFGVIAATSIVALGAIAAVFLSSDPADAAELSPGEVERQRPAFVPRAMPAVPVAPGGSSERISRDGMPPAGPTPRYPLPPLLAQPPRLPKLEARRLLGQADEIAALEAVQIALSEIGDGASYVWHRDHGRLSGVIKPTASYLDRGGRLCRHLHVLLTSGDYVRRAEGVACRDPRGVWSLDG